MAVDQRERPAQVLVVDVNHVRVGDLPRREERTLGRLDARARFLLPLGHVVEAVQFVKVAELFHPRVARVHGGVFR